jgi:8-oxo-dGTP pyrophosphatase MutT (NUDIX family)
MEISCGTVLYTRINGIIYYVLVQSYDDGYCGFPKGHMEGKETEEQTALRETWEEVSIKAEIEDIFRKEIIYKLPNGSEKKAVYYIAHYNNQIPSHNPGFEDKRILILGYDEAYKVLTYEDSKNIIKEVNSILTSN